MSFRPHPFASFPLIASALLATLTCTEALADRTGLSCESEGCGPLPEGFSIPFDRCSTAKPELFGSAPPKVTGAEEGRFVEIDLGEEGASSETTKPGRLWVGVSTEGAPLVAAFAPGSKTATWCQALGDFDGVAMYGSALDARVDTHGIPSVSISAFVRMGGCASEGDYATVAWLALSKRWVVLRTQADPASRCNDEEEPDPAEAEYKRVQRIYDAGTKAYRAKDFATAEKKWRSIPKDPRAAADLGFLLDQTGRHTEAEPLLIDAVSYDVREASWLNLGDLYWEAGHHALGAVAYRKYLTELADPNRLHPGEKPKTPVKRAVERSR